MLYNNIDKNEENNNREAEDSWTISASIRFTLLESDEKIMIIIFHQALDQLDLVMTYDFL